MNELRDYLKEYVTDIEQILQDCQTDKAMKQAAAKKWPENDPRRLVFMLPATRMPKSPSDGEGSDKRLPNEMPAPLYEFSQSPNDADGSDKHLSNEMPTPAQSVKKGK